MVPPGDSDPVNSGRTLAQDGNPGLRFGSRLQHFLSMEPAALVAYVEAESERLASAERELNRARAALAAAQSRQERERAADEVRRLAGYVFRPYSSGVYVSTPRWGKPSLQQLFGRETVFSVLVDSEAACSEIARSGLRVCSRSGDVTTALATREALLALGRSGAQGSVRLARAWAPDLLDVVPDAGIDDAQNLPPPSGTIAGTYLGERVLIGAVDSWFDLHHEDFRAAPLNARVVAYWDQTLTGAGTAPPALGPLLPSPPGLVFSTTAINSELTAASANAAAAYSIVPCVPPSTAGVLDEAARHGTQVLGAAAGNGAAVLLAAVPGGRPGPSPAPNADLVLVRALTVSGSSALCDEALILAAIDYCFQLAESRGQPCVVNLSLTDNQGGHDGLSEGERHLDALLQTPSRALTLAAGNATGTNSHARGSVLGGALPTPLVLDVGPSFANPDSVEIWYDGQESFDLELSFDTVPPSGPVVLVTRTSPILGSNSGVSNGVTIEVENERQDASGDNRIQILFSMPPPAVLPQGRYTFALYASSVVNGEFHAWIDRNNPVRGWSTCLDESQKTLGVPASAFLAISVGNHVKGSPPAVLEASSGRGNTRDGRVKPDLAAAGVSVWVPWPSDRRAPVLEYYRATSGTSISAPIVAGACALLFQRGRSSAMCADLRQILTDLALGPGGVAGLVPEFGWGWGSLYLGDGAVTSDPEVDVWLRDDAADDGTEPFTREVFWSSPDIELLDANGVAVSHARYLPGQRFGNRVRVTVRNRGSSEARNTQVFLHWADPATNIPFPSEWRSSGIYAGAAPGFTDETNCIVVPKLGPKGSATSSAPVEFAWNAPVPGSSLAGDGHFCLLVRVENPADPSGITAGGFSTIVQTNNVGLHNVHVLDGTQAQAPLALGSPPPAPGPGPQRRESRFSIRGSGRLEDLRIWSEGLAVPFELVLPVCVLPWGEIAVLAQSGGRRALTPGRGDDPLRLRTETFERDRARDLARVCGVRELRLEGGLATLQIDPGARACLRGLRLSPGVAVQGCIRIPGERLAPLRGRIHVGQISDGRRAGGVTIELRS